MLGDNIEQLRFIFSGPIGSRVQIGNITFPGLINGNFSHGLTGWNVDGATGASLVAAPVPVPSLSWLITGCALLSLRRSRRKAA